MNDLTRCREEQSRASAWLKAHGECPGCADCRGCRLGASDWLAEEALILSAWPSLPGPQEEWLRLEHAAVRADQRRGS